MRFLTTDEIYEEMEKLWSENDNDNKRVCNQDDDYPDYVKWETNEKKDLPV